MRDDSNAPTGVLLLAYGTPARLEDVEPYFTHIRGGRTPSPEAVEHLKERYERVGGGTPLLQITREVRTELEAELNAGGGAYRVYAGMKHWHPFVADVMREMKADGIRRIIAVVLAPHYSRISIGGYRRAVEEAQASLGEPFDIAFIESWHLEPEFIAMTAANVRAALDTFPPDCDRVLTIFTAHSLPQRIREWDDPYERQLLETSAAVAERAGLGEWRFAWQSAGSTGEPWLEPDILDFLETIHAEGVTAALQVPVGFVSDHLEILYDIDVEAAARAAELGITFARTALPNATPAFIGTLAAIVRRAEAPSAAHA